MTQTTYIQCKEQGHFVVTEQKWRIEARCLANGTNANMFFPWRLLLHVHLLLFIAAVLDIGMSLTCVVLEQKFY